MSRRALLGVVLTGGVAVACGWSPAAAGQAAPVFPPVTAPSGDDDGDRVRDAIDRCPGTAPGGRLFADGCTAAQWLAAPSSPLTARAGLLASATAHVRRIRGVDNRSIRADTRAALNRLDSAARLLERRDACAASRVLSAARANGATATERVNDRIASQRRKLARRRVFGDVDARDLLVIRLAAVRNEMAAARSGLARAAALARQLCRRLGPQRTTTGLVASVDQASRTAQLADGTLVDFSTANLVAGLLPGAQVRIEGLTLTGFGVIASHIVDDGITEADPLVNLASCASLMVVPVQSGSDLVTHPTAGYIQNERYELEAGMGFGTSARAAECDASYSYWMQVDLTYTTREGVRTTQTLAAALGPAEAKRQLVPYDADPDELGQLTARLYRNCLQCPTDLLGSSTRPARINRQESFAQVELDRYEFSVEDGSIDDFDTATLLGRLPSYGSELPGATVVARGYGVEDGKSTYPGTRQMTHGSRIAIHDDAEPSGLLWARYVGEREGAPYWYVARRRPVVTDVVSFCPAASEHSYYRLPWPRGDEEEVTQGNNGELTHNGDQKYAFDFVHEDGEIISAARGGVVQAVVEKHNKTSDPAAVKEGDEEIAPSNYVQIVHQDGTVAQYLHIRTNGVIPKKWDVVERGEWIGHVGNVGNSTGPHLHFHVLDPLTWLTKRIRFEIRGESGPVRCVIPEAGEEYVSTNTLP